MLGWMRWHAYTPDDRPLFAPSALPLAWDGAQPLGIDGSLAEVDSMHSSYELGPGAVTPDGSGGFFFVWSDFWDDGLGTTHAGLFAQHLDANGNIQWPADVQVSTQSFFPPRWLSAIPDGRGGVIACWAAAVFAYTIPPPDERVYVQRIDASGARKWSNTGRRVSSTTGKQNPLVGSDGHWNGLEAVSDGANGVILAWDDSRVDPNFDLYVQRYDSLGTPRWAVGGLAICTTYGVQDHPRIAADGNGGVYVGWEDFIVDPKGLAYLQHVNALGLPLWGACGTQLTSDLGAVEQNLRVAGDGAGGAFVAWEDQRSGNADIYAQHLQADGTRLWAADGIPAAATTYAESPASITASGPDHAIVSWSTYDGFICSYDVRANRVPMDWPVWVGEPAPEPGRLAIRVGPNPGWREATAQLVLPARGAARIEVLDPAGRRVLAHELGWLDPGPHTVPIDLRGTSPGVYTVRLAQGSRTPTTRIVRIR